MSTLCRQTSQNNYKIITFCNTNIYKIKKTHAIFVKLLAHYNKKK